MQKDLIHVFRRSRVLGALPTRARGPHAYPEASTGRFTAVSKRLAEPFDRGDRNRRFAVARAPIEQRVGRVVHVAGVGQLVNRRGICGPLGEVGGLLAARRDMSPTAQDPSSGSCR